MRQVVFIHGGDVYNSYEDYLAHLHTYTIDPFSKQKKWRMTLEQDLGADYEVFSPEMPNKQNAEYAEWKIWIDKYLPHLKDGVVFIGHSLGGIFLAKYLSEERLTFSIGALYLIAAPFFTHDSSEGGSFRLDLERLQGLAHKVGEIALFHSHNDVIVPFSHAEAYARAIKEVRMEVFETRGHFISETFPELIADIKSRG